MFRQIQMHRVFLAAASVAIIALFAVQSWVAAMPIRQLSANLQGAVFGEITTSFVVPVSIDPALSITCGNNVLEGNEQCDPPGGNCTLSCTLVQDPSTLLAALTQATSSAKRKDPPATCGNGFIEKENGEVCDKGPYNGLSAECDRWCGIPYCGDKVIQPSTEECEPELDSSGLFLEKTCGGKVCSVPVCDATGTCAGGCRWTFLPACVVPKSSQSSAASSITPQASSEALIFSIDQSSSLPPSSSSAETVLFSSAGVVASSVGVTNAASSASSASAFMPTFLFASASSVEGSISLDPFKPIEPVRLPAFCGNTIVDLQEECDDGLENSNTTSDSCRMDCTYAHCGDGVKDTGEQCDDGNNILGDGCTPTCTTASCGNGTLEAGEECDEGKNNNDAKPNGCSTKCVLPRCGDGLVDTLFGETCDDGQKNSNILPGKCRLNCANPRCGDGVKDLAEECDDGNASNADSCSIACTSIVCGDGKQEFNETCDDGNTLSEDGCSNQCLLEEASFWQKIWRQLTSVFN